MLLAILLALLVCRRRSYYGPYWGGPYHRGYGPYYGGYHYGHRWPPYYGYRYGHRPYWW